MTELAREEALALARGLIEQSPAAETEVTVEWTRERFARFAAQGPTQDADRERLEVGVRVRVERDGGFGEARAEATSADPAAHARALQRALELARSAPLERGALPLGGPVDVPESRAVDATAQHTFEEKRAWIELALARTRSAGLRPAGLAQTLELSRALANSAGRAVFGSLSRASFQIAASGEDGSGFAEVAGRDARAVDVERAIERAVETARAARNPAAIDPGTYAVVLAPRAVSALVLFMAYEGFGAREVAEQSSFLCGRLGTQLFSEQLSIADDACDPAHPALGFDGEGSRKCRVELVDRGRCVGFVTDRRHAGPLGVESTGHALPQPSASGPLPQNLVIAAGEASADELAAAVGNGLFVSHLHYVNAVDPRELALTGVTRHGTFRIERGRIAGPVRNLRFTDGLLAALSRVVAVGSGRELAGALFEGEVVAPALALAGLRFTSGAEG